MLIYRLAMELFLVETGSRVELYHEHGLEVLLIAVGVSARGYSVATARSLDFPELAYEQI